MSSINQEAKRGGFSAQTQIISARDLVPSEKAMKYGYFAEGLSRLCSVVSRMGITVSSEKHLSMESCMGKSKR